jgi:hypothetical protein
MAAAFQPGPSTARSSSTERDTVQQEQHSRTPDIVRAAAETVTVPETAARGRALTTLLGAVESVPAL